MNEHPPIESACRDEVAELHAFFESWFRGAADHVIARLSDALSPTFRMIDPNGTVLTRDEVIDHVNGFFGAEPDTRIWIENHEHRLTHVDVAVVNYEEWQIRAGATRARISTAVFEICPDAPRGVRWLHLHECWKAD